MIDRLKFESTQLSNGIWVHTKALDLPFALAHIIVPVGHSHNTGSVLPGTAHFLEHMLCNRSERYPERNAYDRFVAVHGGFANATTSAWRTQYKLKTHYTVFEEAFKGLVSRVFYPIIPEQDLPLEVGSISSERRRVGYLWPTTNRLDYHSETQWLFACPNSLRQTFGEDEDLNRITSEKLLELHRNYFDPRVGVFVVGNFDKDLVLKDVESLTIGGQHNLAVEYEQIHWTNRSYHEVCMKSGTRFIYSVGGITPSLELEDSLLLNSLDTILVHPIVGGLFSWLRYELGWCYDLSFEYAPDEVLNSWWMLRVPLTNREQVEKVRKELRSKIVSTLENSENVRLALEYKKCSIELGMETAQSIMNTAKSYWRRYRRIPNEEELFPLLDRCKNTSVLLNFFDRYMSSDESVGEFLAVPSE